MKKLMFILIFLLLITPELIFAEEGKWVGLDEAVIEKLAEERGKKSKPLFELEGDLELFMFSLLFGISGFAAGYYWRKLFSEKKDVATTS